MKYGLWIICMLIATTRLKAQTFSEWFRQDHTQLRYLQEQIAALAAYDYTTKQGNALAQDSLSTINTIAQADYDQHSAHFTYLKTPSPAIRWYFKQFISK